MFSIWRRVRRGSDLIYGNIKKAIRTVLPVRGDILVDVGIIVRIRKFRDNVYSAISYVERESCYRY